MFIEFFQQHPYVTLSVAAFLVNLPLGYIREQYPRFSLMWFFWIHASIPLIIYLRITLGTSKLFIPISIFIAILGQVISSRLYIRNRSKEKMDSLNQIPNLSKRSKVNSSEVMVVLLNMGGPKTSVDIPDFQKRLFSDRQLIRFPMGFLFQGLFAQLLVKLRGKAAAKRYQLIGGGSPIFESTGNQTEALREELKRRNCGADVTFSFNYSEPLPEKTIEIAKQAGKKYIFPLSLYPHYSKATTGSNIHYLKKAAQKTYPEIQFLKTPSYHLHDGYIQAFVDRIYEQIKNDESLDDFYIIFSAHSLPLYFLKEGDIYPFQISQTVAKMVGQLNRKNNWIISYQSAVGPLEWIKPATEAVIKALAREGFKKIL
ncbi:Ferrochelatase, protoheme ferro-lyase, partial [hydrothermal vent metagenome]